jgi:hypothetical protein
MTTRIQTLMFSILSATAATVALDAQGRVTNLDIRDALMRGGLHEAARVAGGFYKMTDKAGPDLLVPDLVSIVNVSDAVVVGTPKSNVCHLTKNGMSITTDFRVVAGQVLYGDTPPGREIIVSVQGGRVQFWDGLVAEVAMLGLSRPEHESRVVMFLEKNRFASDELVSWAKDAPLYRTVLGPMGMFTLGSDDSSEIKLHSHRTDPVLRAHRGESTGQFLQSVRGAIATGHPRGSPKH